VKLPLFDPVCLRLSVTTEKAKTEMVMSMAVCLASPTVECKEHFSRLLEIIPELMAVAGMKTRTRKPVQAQKSSGNVFADLDLAHPEQELLRARLTLQIYRLIKERGLTQEQAGEILGLKQPNVSALMRNRSGLFSIERLLDFLTLLGQDVEIVVRPAHKPQGEVSVSV
jgi:predicted XRE-type DNA-binding protein